MRNRGHYNRRRRGAFLGGGSVLDFSCSVVGFVLGLGLFGLGVFRDILGRAGLVGACVPAIGDYGDGHDERVLQHLDVEPDDRDGERHDGYILLRRSEHGGKQMRSN